MLAHYLCISERKGTQGLKNMAWEFTDMGGYDNDLDKFKETLPEADRSNYELIPWSILSPYGAADADCALRLLHIFKPKIDANPKWKRIMEEIYIPASYALLQVEEWGMHMNLEKVEIYQKAYEIELRKVVDELNSYPEIARMERDKRDLYAQRQALLKSVPAKQRTKEQVDFIKKTQKYKEYKFNWSSPNQLKELFYEVLGLDCEIKTKEGELSTNKEALEELASQHPIPEKLVEYRKLKILKDMFIDKIPEMKDKNDCIHPGFLLTGTETCRLASVNPRLQQLGF
jgi:DNA polymerase I-like protein with 3'-5' exonuclease and polymerase domains